MTEDCPVHQRGQYHGIRAATAHNFGNIHSRHGLVAGILALRREDHINAGLPASAGNFQAMRIAGLKKWRNDFFRSARISGAFEHDQLALMNVRSDGLDRSGYVFQVGFIRYVQRCGHAEDDRIHRGDLRVITRGAEASFLRCLNFSGWDTNDIGTARVQCFHLVRSNIEARHPKPLAAEEQRQR